MFFKTNLQIPLKKKKETKRWTARLEPEILFWLVQMSAVVLPW